MLHLCNLIGQEISQWQNILCVPLGKDVVCATLYITPCVIANNFIKYGQPFCAILPIKFFSYLYKQGRYPPNTDR